MAVWHISRHFDFDTFDINFRRSTLYSCLEKQYRLSDTRRWWVPTRFGALEPMPFIPVSKAALWPDVIGLYPSGLVISERFAELVRVYCPARAELFPVDVEGPRRSPPPRAYFYLNVVHEVDAANLRAMRIKLAEEYPDMKMMFLPNDRPPAPFDWILDPDQVPARSSIFTLKYVQNVFVAGELGERLLAARLTWLKLDPVLLRRENCAQRRARIAKFRRICRAYRPPPEPEKITSVRALESRLGVRLPEKFGRFQRESKEFVFKGGEVFDLSQTATHTRDLREWKELDWPEHLVVISDDGRGGYFALDTSKVGDGDCPVVYFDHELATVDRKTGRITPELEAAAPTFEAWVSRLKRGGSPLPR